MKRETSKKSKLWLWLVIGLVVLLAAGGVTAFLLMSPSDSDATEPTDTTGITENAGGRPELYWNVDRAIYTKDASTSTREPGEDGVYKIRFAYNGTLVEKSVADKKLVNYIDTLDALGLIFDENGNIVDAVAPKEIAKEMAKNAFVKTTRGETIEANTSVAMNGMPIKIKMVEGAEIYDVTPEAENPGSVMNVGALKPMDTLTVYGDEEGNPTHIFVTSHARESKVYWRADQQYNSTAKETARVPDENGVYTVPFFCDGERVELKFKDKAIVTKIDSTSRWKCHFGFTFDEEGYVVEQFVSSLGISGLIVADCWDVVDIQGEEVTVQRLVTNDGSNWTGTIPAGTIIYDVGPVAKSDKVAGQTVDSLQIGDRVTIWTDTLGNVIMVYVSNRITDAPAAWVPTRKYNSTLKETTRTIGDSGYYEVELLVEGSNKKETYYIKDKETMTYLDSITAKMVGVRFDSNRVIQAVYDPESLTGYTTATRGGIVTKVTGSIITKISYGKRGTDANLILAPDVKIYNASGYGTLGAETTLREGDHIYAQRQPTGELLLVYVTKRTIGGDKLYWNLELLWDKENKTSTRVPDAEGWYYFTMAHRGKQVTLKTQNKELVDKIDKLSIGATALDVNGDVITGVYDAGYPYGGNKVASGYRYQYRTSEGKYFCTYASDASKTVEFAMAEDCVIYNVSPIFNEFKGERISSIPKNAMLTVFCDMYGEAKVVYVRSQATKDMYWKTEILYDSTNKVTKRVPDADGYYWYTLAVNGECKTFKTKDQKVANSMDSYAGAFGLNVRGDEIFGFVSTSSVLGVSGNGFTTATIKAINGKTITVVTAKGTETMKLSSDCKIYDVSPVAASFGAPAQLKVGDVVRTYLNTEKTLHNYVYIKARAARVNGETGFCTVCQKEVTWKPMDTSSAISAADGHWYVPANMTQWVQSSFASTGKDYTICLDLNGKTLTRAENGRNFRVAYNETLNIMDSVGGGKIVTHGGTGYNGGLIMISNGGKVNMYGGTLEYVDTGIRNGYGGTIYLSGEESVFNLYDGVITGGISHTHAKDKPGSGGNFYIVAGATLNMYGGEISGGTVYGGLVGTADKDGNIVQSAVAAYGGNIYMSESSMVNIYGGVVKDGRAIRETFTYIDGGVEKTASNLTYGGNIYKVNTNKLDGRLYIQDATVAGGQAHRGGNIMTTTGSAGRIELKNATIAGGHASQFGGNIMSIGGQWTITDSDILNGVSDQVGGNIYSQGGVFETVVNTTIAGGQAATTGGNVYLYKNKTDDNIFIVGEGTVVEGGAASTGGNFYLKSKNYVLLPDGTVVAPADDTNKVGTAMLPVLVLAGGEIKNGQADTGANIYTAGHLSLQAGKIQGGDVYFTGENAAMLDIAGGVADCELLVKAPVSFDIYGAPKLSNLTFDKNVKATIGELTDGADIKVTTNYASPVFTNSFDNAQAYLDAGYISGAEEGSTVTVTAENELSLTAAPPESKMIYCEHCQQEVEFTEWTYESGSYTRENGHFFLDKDESISANHRIGNSSSDKAADAVDVVIDLNGHNITSSGPVFYVYPYSTLTLQDSVGTSVVSGAGVLRKSLPGDGGLFYVENGNLNIYGGTYNLVDTDKVNNGGVIRNGGTTKIYGGTFNGNTIAGLGSAVYSTKNLEIYGGTFSGEVYARSSLTLAGAPVIETLQIPEGNLATLGDLTNGADITVEALGVFTKPNTNAKAYVEAGYIKSGTSDELTVTILNELSLGEVVIEGLLEYACPHCDGAIAQWIPYDANKVATDNSGVLVGSNSHYYIPDGGYVQSYGQVSIQGEVTLDFHGQTLTGKGSSDGSVECKRLWRIEGTFNILDTVGGGKAIAYGLENNGGAMAMTRVNPTTGEKAVINMYSGTLTMFEDCKAGSSGGILSIAGGTVMNMYGGEIYGGKTTHEHAHNIYVGDGTLNMQGGFIDGGVEISASAKVSLSGTAKIGSNNGGMWIAKDKMITLGAMETGAEVYVSIDETAYITETLTNAEAYLEYIKPAVTGWAVEVQNNALVLTNGEAPEVPFDPNAVYEQAKAMDFTTDDPDGKVTAVCPVCREEVEWNILPANATGTSNTSVESGHYYLSESVDYTQNNGLYNFTKKQVCINLNGQTMISTVRAFYTENTSSVLNMMGEGTVSGAGYMGTGSNAAKGFGAFDLTSNANFYGGTYISTGAGPAIGNRKTSAGDALVSIFAGTTVINETADGCAVHVMGNGSVAINGGTINGAVVDNNSKGITVSGAPVINALDLTNGEKIKVEELTDGANITVLADGVFTEDFTNAQTYLDAGYFVSGVADTELKVEGSALAIRAATGGTEPQPPVTDEPDDDVYEMAKAMDFSAGGTVTATCPVCGTEVEWEALPAITTSRGIYEDGAHHHFYLDANTDYTGIGNFYYIKSGTKVCLNLNGQNMTSSARLFVTESENTVLNIMGEGTLRGSASYNSNNLNWNGSVIDATAAVNLYGGTIIGNNEAPAVSLRGSKAYSVVSIYDGTKIIRTAEDAQGTNVYVCDGSTLNIYGGEIRGGSAVLTPSVHETEKYGGNIVMRPNAKTYAYSPVINIYGGIIADGTAATAGGNIAVIGNTNTAANATLNIMGGTIENGSVYSTGANTVINISGNPTVDYLEMAAANLVNVADMTEGASIKVLAPEGVPFTTVIAANAVEYAQYFYGDGEHVGAVVVDNALQLAAICPHCGVAIADISWTDIANTDQSHKFTESGHYRLTENFQNTKSGNAFTFADATATTGLEVVLDTRGFNIDCTTGRCFYVAKYNKFTVFDSVGGTVATSTSTNSGLGGSGLVAYAGAEANIYDITLNGSEGANGRGNCVSVYATSTVVNIYSGTFNGTNCTVSGNSGGTVYNHGTLNIYGGTFSDAELTDALGGCLYSDGTLNIADAELKGDVYIAAGEATLSGATKIADLQIFDGLKITLGELTEGSDITVTAVAEFTNANANAQSYVDNGYIKAANGKQITVDGNVLSMSDVAVRGRIRAGKVETIK